MATQQPKAEPRPASDATERMRASTPAAETVIGRVDRYQLLERLGTGGFGAVYRARDEVADLQVAIKALPALVAHNPDELAAVRDNFRLVAKLRHPNIANVLHLHEVVEVDPVAHELMRVAQGDWLVVMDYVPGVTVSGWRRAFAEGRVTLEQALPILEQIAEALDFAHSCNIIHRDIKPANVIIGPDGHVRVLDFGLAAEIRTSISRVSHSIEDTSGTPAYMAPEQWAGRSQGATVDQYSLGVLTYELLGGVIPFASAFATGSRMVMYNAVRSESPARLRHLSRRENRALSRALAKNPRDRFGSCRAFIAALAGKRASGAPVGLAGEAAGGRNQAGPAAAEPAQDGPRLGAVLLGTALLGLVSYFGLAQYQEFQRREAGQRQVLQAAAARNRHVAEYLASARDACSRRDLPAAMDTVNRALALDPNHSQAKALKAEIAAAVGPDVIVPIQSDADMTRKRLEQLDRGQGVGEAVDRAGKILSAAQMLYEAQEYELALERYRQFLQAAERLTRLNETRQTAQRERRATEQNQASAAGAQAPVYAKELLAGAARLADSAAVAFDKGAFDESAKLWISAAAEFAKAEAFARGACAVAEKEAAYQAAFGKVDTKLLEEFGGTAWSGVKELVADASRRLAEGKWNEAAGQWDEALHGLSEAVRVAEEARHAARSKAAAPTPPANGTDAWRGAVLAEALAKAEAAKAEGDWEGVLRFVAEVLAADPESARAKLLRQEADEALTPRLTVVSEIGGREVAGAEVTVDGVRQDARTPLTLKLQRGRQYAIRVRLPPVKGGTRYAPVVASYVAEKGGAQALRVALPEAALSADLVEVPTAERAPVEGLAEGSAEAQLQQVQAVEDMLLPLAVRTRKAGLILRLVPAGVVERQTLVAGQPTPAAEDVAAAADRAVIIEPLYVGVHEVTRAEWRAVMGTPTAEAGSDQAGLPMADVSWQDCQDFCRRLCEVEGVPPQTYRLLTEVEWEYVCRAGTASTFCSGSGPKELATVGWFAGNSGAQPHAVGQLLGNAWGLHDLHGNVGEWCQDQPAGDEAAGTNAGGDDGSRVVRGGSWETDALACGAAGRQTFPAKTRDRRVGLRVARIAHQP